MRILTRSVVLFSCLLSCGSAFAHAHLTAAMPADGAVMASAPAALSLSFSEGLELKLSGATLKGSDGAPVAIGATSLGATDDKVMRIALPVSLGVGAYTVDWHAFSHDGHATRGTYHFMVGR